MASAAQMETHFRKIGDTSMRDLPICNPRLQVEAVGFDSFGPHQLGVMITPWFINLVLLPGDDEWDDCEQGQRCDIELPAGDYEFTVGHDDALGTSLSAVLFRSVSAFPDQATARDTAEEVLRLVRQPAEAPAPATPAGKRKLSRRALLRGEMARA